MVGNQSLKWLKTLENNFNFHFKYRCGNNPDNCDNNAFNIHNLPLIYNYDCNIADNENNNENVNDYGNNNENDIDNNNNEYTKALPKQQRCHSG